jgi:transposase
MMRLVRTGKSTNPCYYVVETYRNEKGAKSTRTVEALGNAESIRAKYAVSDAEEWCRNYICQKNEELAKAKESNSREVQIKLLENLPKSQDSAIYNIGHIILESVYNSFGLSNICDEITRSHPHLEFDLNEVLKVIVYGRILFPSSKHRLAVRYQFNLLGNSSVELQHIYRGMDLLNSNNTLIQDRLYYYTSQDVERDVSCIYYDCTNFYAEIECEDCDRENKSEEWHSEHTLRKYGKSKENRPNPIVQIGLFMDSNGMPLGFCINPGNTNEQVTLVPTEEKLIKNFRTSDVTVCTDCGLSSDVNYKFNSKEADDPLVKLGLCGQRHYISTRSLKKMKSHLKDWALGKKGWSYVSKEHSTGKTKIISDYDLTDLNDVSEYTKHFNTVFFKERTTAENNIDARLIVTFSLKFKEYLENLRNKKVMRAQKMIKNGTHSKENENSPRRYIDRNFITQEGEVADIQTVSINDTQIKEDARYDGFYALNTNFFSGEKSVQEIVAIAAKRWEIEECFRIMKSDLELRPFFHNKDPRIIAHVQTCFIALLLLRGIEYKLAKFHGVHEKWPNGKYTMDEILNALRSIKVISLNKGQAYQPDYKDSEVITDLLELFSLKAFSKQIIMKDTMKKIFQQVKKSPKPFKP